MDDLGRDPRCSPGSQGRERVLTPSQFTVTRREHVPDFFIESPLRPIGAVGINIGDGTLDLLAAFSESGIGILSKEVDFLLDGIQPLLPGIRCPGFVSQQRTGSVLAIFAVFVDQWFLVDVARPLQDEFDRPSPFGFPACPKTVKHRLRQIDRKRVRCRVRMKRAPDDVSILATVELQLVHEDLGRELYHSSSDWMTRGLSFFRLYVA
jgi:hypothetical protein